MLQNYQELIWSYYCLSSRGISKIWFHNSWRNTGAQIYWWVDEFRIFLEVDTSYVATIIDTTGTLCMNFTYQELSVLSTSKLYSEVLPRDQNQWMIEWISKWRLYPNEAIVENASSFSGWTVRGRYDQTPWGLWRIRPQPPQMADRSKVIF